MGGVKSGAANLYALLLMNFKKIIKTGLESINGGFLSQKLEFNLNRG